MTEDAFRLHEQVRDLTLQVSARNADIQQVVQQLAKKSEELEQLKTGYNETAKKTKSVLVGANKSISELRASALEKDASIARLTAELDKAQQRSSLAEDALSILKLEGGQVRNELQTLERTAALQIGNLTGEVDRQSKRATSVEAKFNAYRQKATAILLQQTQASTDEVKKSYEGQITRLTTEYEYAMQLLTTERKRSELLATEKENLSAKLSNEVEENASMQVQLHRLQKQREELVSDRSAEGEKLQAVLESQREIHLREIESIRHTLNDQLKNKDILLLQLTEELEKCKVIISTRDRSTTSPIIQPTSKTSPSISPKLKNKLLQHQQNHQSEDILNKSVVSDMNDVESEPELLNSPVTYAPASLSHLLIGSPYTSISTHSLTSPPLSGTPTLTLASSLNPRLAAVSKYIAGIIGTEPATESSTISGLAVSAGGGDSVTKGYSGSERELMMQVKMLQNLLRESEIMSAQLLEQEKLLKQELRKVESERTLESTLNVKYLKNILLKFAMAVDKEPLLPVLGKLLHLTPSEKQDLKSGWARK